MSRDLVKFVDPTLKTRYGVVLDNYSAQAKALAQEGKDLVIDAVLPVSYVVFDKDLVDIKFKLGHCDASGKFVGIDEYQAYIQDELAKAKAVSEALPDGVHVGSLFWLDVGDGRAWYVVTKVNRRTCKVEWRGFCMDRWTDHHFGWGGVFPIEEIKRYVDLQRAREQLFAKKPSEG